MSTMELHVWDGEPDWGLPSMDLDSLQMMLYVKFSGAPVNIIKSVNPASAPRGTLPVFQCSEGAFTDFTTMTAYLRKHNYSCDHDLSGRQCSDVMAYQYLLKEKLYPALIYLWWVEPLSYHEVIHSWFYSHMRFPLKLWVPSRRHKESQRFIHALVDEPDDIPAVETQLLKHALECLTLLSTRLGEREYFFGQTPTTLDAVLCGYLALLLKVDLKVPVLQNHVKACPNLSRYVFKTMQRYFPSESSSGKGQSSGSYRPHGTSEKPASDEEFPNKRRNLVICLLVAAAANLGYAIATGLVQVDMGERAMIEDDYEEEYETNENCGE